MNSKISDPEEIAKILMQQANNLLFNLNVDKLLSRYGEVVYAGSYGLDLLAWPDLDIYLFPFEKENQEMILVNLAKQFLQFPEIFLIKFERNLHLRNTKCPEGLYLQIKLNYVNPIPWKLDVWIMNKEKKADIINYHNSIKERLSHQSRKIILSTKQSLITSKGRTPSFSGFYIYEAVLFKNIYRFEDIVQYLKEQGVDLSDTLNGILAELKF